MKTKILCTALTLTAGALLAAETSPKDEISGAAKKLAQQGNYAWKTEVEFSGNAVGSLEGKTQKDGLVQLTMAFGGFQSEAFLKGTNGAVKQQEEAWRSLTELAAAEGDEARQGRMMARILQSYKAPAPEIQDLLSKIKELKQNGEAFAADLTEEGAKALLSLGGRRGGEMPEPSKAKGAVKLWLKDGLPVKYELKLEGTYGDRDMDRTTTIEIKEVGKAKVELPEEAKKKLP